MGHLKLKLDLKKVQFENRYNHFQDPNINLIDFRQNISPNTPSLSNKFCDLTSLIPRGGVRLVMLPFYPVLQVSSHIAHVQVHKNPTKRIKEIRLLNK